MAESHHVSARRVLVARNEAVARQVFGKLQDRVDQLRRFVPWPALIEVWERELAEAEAFMIKMKWM